MTDEKFEQILQQALIPEVTNEDIQIYKRVRKNTMNKIAKIGIVAACAALIITTNIGNSFLGNMFTPGNQTGAAADDSSFVMTCFAAELGDGDVVSVPSTISGKSSNGYAVCGVEDDNSVSYAIGTEFNCEGENIASVTYSINDGMFGITQLKESRLTTEYVEYGGAEFAHPDIAFDDEELEEGQDPSESKYEKIYVSEYTVPYDRQSMDTAIVGIYGSKADESIFQSVFGTEKSEEQVAAGYTSMMDGVEITCTVNYTDGTTESKTIIVKGCLQNEDGNEMASFAYELK